MEIFRLLNNICSDDLPASKAFYTDLFDFNVNYDSEWFVHLISAANQLEIGIIQWNHELIPAANQYRHPQATYLSFVVQDVDEMYEQLIMRDIPIIEPPQETFYGQKRLLTQDPNGLLIDISSPVRRK